MFAMRKMRPGLGEIEIAQLPVPEPGPGEVRLRVTAGGVCGTDLHIYHGVPEIARMLKLPVVMGHEISGVVDAVAPGIQRVAVGDRVSLESHIPCGACYPCRLGRTHICRNTGYPGVTRDGGFAEYVVVPEPIAWVHPADMDLEIAALFEPFGIAVHASLEGRGVAGLNVMITGCGPIGLMNVAVARALGAQTIIATDINPVRLALAERLGADRPVDVRTADPVAVARECTRGDGVDVVIEYSGQESALAQGVEALVPGGDLRLVGAAAGPMKVDLTRWILKGLRVQGIHGRKLFESWEYASRLVNNS
ncbi:MAG: zinc-binding dehydrogenase, partial [Candidatus Binatia bacterium]